MQTAMTHSLRQQTVSDVLDLANSAKLRIGFIIMLFAYFSHNGPDSVGRLDT